MKVLYVGYSDCETMAEVFRQLGFNNYTFDENYNKLREEWMKIFVKGATREDFRRIFHNVDSLTGMPACYFWEEILEAFPQTKIVFMEDENEDDWWRNFHDQVRTDYSLLFKSPFYILSPTFIKMWSFLSAMNKAVFGHLFRRTWKGQMVFNELAARMSYRQHNCHIMEAAPSNQLLIYRVDDGWEPLCEFLDVPKPNGEFPRMKTTETLIKKEYIKKIGSEVTIGIGVVSFISSYLILKAMKGEPLPRPPGLTSFINYLTAKQS